jgi:hypothetical protein
MLESCNRFQKLQKRCPQAPYDNSIVKSHFLLTNRLRLFHCKIIAGYYAIQNHPSLFFDFKCTFVKNKDKGIAVFLKFSTEKERDMFQKENHWLDTGESFPGLSLQTLDRDLVQVPEYMKGGYGVLLIFRGYW